MTTTWRISQRIVLTMLIAAGCSTAFAQKPRPTELKSFTALYPPLEGAKIERVDPRLDKLIPRDARIEMLAEGFAWCEGPVWLKDKQALVFSDIPNNVIRQWKSGEGLSVFMEKAGYTGSTPRGGEPGTNGLTVDSQGRLTMCEHGDRRITRLEKDGKKTVLADRYEGKKFNSPNDLVYKSNGDLYFTDPPYGLVGNWNDPAREQAFCGVYRVASDGKVTLLNKDMTRPNGINFSPDEKTLYVAQSDPDKAIWMAFPVKEDGTLGEGKQFYDATAWAKAGKPGLPDGLEVDKDGNLFLSGPGGIHIFTPDGTLLGSLNTGERTANCNWGDDGTVLYMCADAYICRIKTNTKGRGW